MDSVYAKNHMEWLNDYACMHYGSRQLRDKWNIFLPAENFDFIEKLSKLCIDSTDQKCRNTRALDLGCCVGAVTFNLAAKFDEVIGVDCSKGYLEICKELKNTGEFPIYASGEGKLQTEILAEVPKAVDRHRCSFVLGDVNSLPLDIGKFGCVVVSNVVDRLPDPRQFLRNVHKLVDDHGHCVLASPHNSLETFTPKENWLGGYAGLDGTEISASNTIKEILSQELEFVESHEIPFVIQYTSRNFELAISEVQVWKKIPK